MRRRGSRGRGGPCLVRRWSLGRERRSKTGPLSSSESPVRSVPDTDNWPTHGRRKLVPPLRSHAKRQRTRLPSWSITLSTLDDMTLTEYVRDDGRVAHITKEPIGVVAAITPWNAPLISLCYKVGAALAAGCTLVAKPTSETPIEAYNILAECMDEAGLPPGVFNLVPAGREAASIWSRTLVSIRSTGSKLSP